MEKIIDRFWKKVDTKNMDDCWNWLGATSPKGYGFFSINGSNSYAHRVSYTLHFGEIPIRLQVLHECDNPSCVNPRHLFLGTRKDNMEDMVKKGRSTKGRAFMIGNNHYNVKLNENKVKEIRNLYATGKFTYHNLADRYGVAYQTIGDIISNRRWKHVL